MEDGYYWAKWQVHSGTAIEVVDVSEGDVFRAGDDTFHSPEDFLFYGKVEPPVIADT